MKKFLSRISWNRPHTIKLKKPLRFVFSRGWPKKQWCLRIHFGPGAGYIGGFSIYLARNCYRPFRRHEGRRPWLFGITRNWNKIPFTEN